jgi:glycosyltransferase 2 family protein
VKKTALLVGKIAVSLGLLGYLFSTTDMGALLDRVRRGDLVLLVAAGVLYLLMLGVATWRWRLLLLAQGFAARLGPLSASYLVASFFNNFLPSNIGGDVVRVRDSAQITGSTTTSLAIVAIDRILGLGALYVLAVLAFAFADPQEREFAGARSILLLLGLVFATLAYVFFRPGVARRVMHATRLSALPWARERFHVVQAAVHVYRARMRDVWVAFGASVALQALAVLYFHSVARALAIPLDLSASFLMVPLCTLIQTVPVSFNGWGVRESVFILYFHQVGLPRESALAFSLVGAGLIVLLSLSGAIVWMARGETLAANGGPR